MKAYIFTDSIGREFYDVLLFPGQVAISYHNGYFKIDSDDETLDTFTSKAAKLYFSKKIKSKDISTYDFQKLEEIIQKGNPNLISLINKLFND